MIKLPILIILQYNLFLHAIRLEICVIKLLINFFFNYFVFLINVKPKNLRDIIISHDPFSLRYVPDQYKTAQTCDKAVDDCLTTLKFVPDWFVTSKMIKMLFTALYADKNILYFNEDSGNFVLCCNRMGILNIDLNNINLDNNFDEDDPDTIILIRLFA